MHPALLVIVYVGLALAPLTLAYAQDKPPRPIWDELSSGVALTAFSILLVEFLLSGRFHSISKRIGMDVTMRFHQLLARTATVFVLVHPFLYTTPTGIPRPDDITRLGHLGLTGPSIASGLIAWFLVMVLVSIAIFRNQIGYTYEAWRASHAFGAILIAALSAHHAFSAGRYSGDATLHLFWLVLLVAAGGTIVLVYLVRPLVRLRSPYRVDSVRQVALKTWRVDIKPTRNKALNFVAGQFVWLRIGRSPFSLHENPFSIASAPASRSRLSFVIKEQGDFTSAIGQIAPGAVAYVDGPYGNLTLERRRAAGIALIAGGVGIAPLLSILRQLQSDGDRRPIILVYGNRCQEQIVHLDELQTMSEALDLRVAHVLSEPPPDWRGYTGMIDGALLKQLFSFDGADRWCYFLCGPPAMIEAAERALLEKSIPDRQIVSERFNYD
jgi:predicted ferric reductase